MLMKFIFIYSTRPASIILDPYLTRVHFQLKHVRKFLGPGILCAPHVMVDGSKAGHCFHLLFPLFNFFLCLLFTHFGETPLAEILFPPIFWHELREYLKNIVDFIFMEKNLFSRVFFCFLQPAFGRGAWTDP